MRTRLHTLPESIRREAADSHSVHSDRLRAQILGGVPRVAVMPAPVCWYCGKPATNRCTEKMAEPWIALPGELHPFALIQDSDLQWVVIDSIERRLASSYGTPWLDAEVYIARVRRRAGIAERMLRPLLPVLEIRNEPCDRPACDSCARDLGDGEHFRCRRHWFEDAPRPESELELSRLWEGLLETTAPRKNTNAKT